MYMNATTESKVLRQRGPRRLALLALLLAGLLACAGPAQAQEPEDLIGTIPGTQMSRDEFRARAMAQLATISLAALTYLEVNGKYPEEFYKLRGSRAWNIEVNNMFKARPVQSIPFEPGPSDYTSTPPLGLPGNFDMPTASGPPMTSHAPGAEPGASQGTSGLPPVDSWTFSSGVGRRVDASKVSGYVPGDIFYYVNEGLLQLVLFAPDGSYYEWVDEVPNPNFRESLRLRVKKDPEGTALYSAQVLYFTEQILPKYYNLVQFMASQPTEPQQALQRTPASERISMASKLGLEIRNVLTRQPISIGMASGDFAEEGGNGAPISILLGEQALSLHDLTLDPGEVSAKEAGSKASGSNGRQPGGKSGDKPKPRPGHGGGGRQPK